MLNSFKLVELKSNGEKDYFIEGFVSTINPDDYNDVVTPKAQKAIDTQLKKFNITMDLEHEEWINPNTGERHQRKQNKIPVALVVDSNITDEGTFVRAKLNKNHPLFTNVLKSIQEGFLHSFSIAYDVTQRQIKQIGDKVFRFIEDLNISNIGITGNPVNKGATFRVALKSISKKMVEESKFEELQTQFSELKSMIESQNSFNEKFESLTNEVAELKACVKAMEDSKKTEKEEEEKKEKEVKSKSELESFSAKLEEQSKIISELKSTLEKVRSTPIAGAELKSHTVEKKELEEINFISLM